MYLIYYFFGTSFVNNIVYFLAVFFFFPAFAGVYPTCRSMEYMCSH